MNLKNLTLILLIFTIISCSTKNTVNPENYIELEYQKKPTNDKVLSKIQTKIKGSNDSIGKFIKNHEQRFTYFFSSKTDLDSLIKMYPDTIQIKKAFLKQINDKQFVSNFENLVNVKKQNKPFYSIEEVMEVASRFFLVVNSKNTLKLKICSSENEFNDLNSTKDVTLIEAITYEAIITAFDEEKSGQPKFIANTRSYFLEAIKNPDSLNNDALSKLAKNKLYKMMETDKSLKQFINAYYIDNSSNLPFVIKKSE